LRCDRADLRPAHQYLAMLEFDAMRRRVIERAEAIRVAPAPPRYP
jgi:hypothetical protein